MDIKEAVSNVIRNKKIEMDKYYDDKIKEVINETNPANIYLLLAQTDTIREGNIGIDVLKEILTNTFFQEAKIDKGINYTIFSNKEFDIMFSKFLSKEIKIKYKNPCPIAHYYGMLNCTNIHVANLIEIYLNKKTFANYKALVKYNRCGNGNNIIGRIIRYVTTYKNCGKKLLDTVRDKQKRDKIYQAEADEKNKLHKEKQLYAKKFIDGLTDLEIFKDAGWNIRTTGINDNESWF